jgi:hypothetical protein
VESDVAHESTPWNCGARQNTAHKRADDTVCRDILTGQIKSINRRGGS